MKNRSLLIIIVVSLAQISWAQLHDLSIGVRGGAEALLPNSDAQWKSSLGSVTSLDFGYSWYAKEINSIEWGVRTGVAIGFVQNHSTASFCQYYTNYDYLDNKMDYTTKGFITASQQRLWLEIPAMMAMRTHGFILGLGTKIQCSFWDRSKQFLRDPYIGAYYEHLDAYIDNALVIGRVQDEQLTQKSRWNAPAISLLLGTEIGYEWALSNLQFISLSAFVDYNVCNSYKSSGNPVISVSPITNLVNPVPEIAINNAPNSLINAIHPVDFGLKLKYAFGLSARDRKHISDTIYIYQRDTIWQEKTSIQMDTVVQYDTVLVKENIYRIDTVIHIQVDTVQIASPTITNDHHNYAKSRLDEYIGRINAENKKYGINSSKVIKNAITEECLLGIADELIKDPTLRICLVGHTDNIGSHEANLIVGKRRAEALKNELLKLGASSKQIQVESKAETEPLVPNDSPEHQAQNRRVEIMVL